MEMPMGSMTSIAERNNTTLIVKHIRDGVSAILQCYMYQANTPDTIANMQAEVRTYLDQQIQYGNIVQYVDAVQDTNIKNRISFDIAFKPHNISDFIYSPFKIELISSIEDELAQAIAKEIALEIDKEILNCIVDTASTQGLEQIAAINAYPHGGTNEIDDIADIFDEISDEEFIDLIEVITENNDEYKKAQSDEAYQRAMDVL